MESKINECKIIKDKDIIEKIERCKEPMFSCRNRDNMYEDDYFFYIDDHFYMAKSDCYGSQIFPSISFYEITINRFEKEFEKFKKENKGTENVKIKYQILNTTNFLNENKEKFELKKLEVKEDDAKNKIYSLEEKIKNLEQLIKDAPNKLFNYKCELIEAKTELEDIENAKKIKLLKRIKEEK